MLQTVSVSEMQISNTPTDVLVTYSLGSCAGLSLYDPAAEVGGLIHCMLPLSKIDREKAKANPQMFVDTGVPDLLQNMFNLGAQRKRIIAKVAGCAQLLDEKKLFRIGERNYTVLRKVLWKNDILIAAEDIGGSIPRTMFLYMETGVTILKIRGQEVEL